MHKKVIILSTVIVLLAFTHVNAFFFFLGTDLNEESGDSELFEIENLKKSDYWDEDDISFIHITGANWTQTNQTYDWCNGKGIKDNPYVIENITLNGNNSRSCIIIEDSTLVYFIIRNCTLYNSTSSNNAGIKLINTNNGTLINNNCSLNGGYGVYLINSYNNTIFNNTIHQNNNDGIYLESSSDNKMSNNSINYNGDDGIYLYDYSDENTIFGNEIIDNTDEGLYIHSFCDDNVILENDIKINDDLGIYLYIYCDRNKILNNYIYDNADSGIEIAAWSDYNIVSNNRILYNDHQNIFITGTSRSNNITDNIIGYSGWVFGVWIYDTLCSENNIYGNYFYGGDRGQDEGTNNNWDNGEYGNYWDNYAGDDIDDDGIGDDPLPFNGGSDPLPIWNDGIEDDNITIDAMAKGVNAHNWTWAAGRFWCSGSGIYSDPYIITYYRIWSLVVNGQGIHSCVSISNSTEHFVIEDATFTNSGNPEAGIILYNTSNGKIHNTNCSKNLGSGIIIKQKCNNITIISNLVKENGIAGISINTGSYNNTITENTIEGNTVQDIGLKLSLNCIENSITGNNITKCDQRGIEISNNCNNNTFSYNRIIDNLNYGILILDETSDCEDNAFYINHFENSNGINAYDNGTNNRWDNGSIGNYWHDYTGCDSNNDNIGETPYIIHGDAKAQDNFPICTTKCLISTNGGGGGGGGSGDGDSKESIPFGNYYLIFLVFGVAIIIIFKRRRIIFKSR
jgi:parallel beta-helix repeat protein